MSEYTWLNDAIDFLDRSLKPVPQERNGLDWKAGLSPKSERLAQHLSAFANHEGGGYLTFGIDDSGKSTPISKDEADEIVKRLANVARNNLSEALTLETATALYEGQPVLFIKVPQGRERPVHLRGGAHYDSYKRSAGTTEKMSKADVTLLLATRNGSSFEEGVALRDVDADTVLNLLDHDSYFRLMKVRRPETKAAILAQLASEGLVAESAVAKWDVTNLGALLFARDISIFKALQFKLPRLVVYQGTSRIQAERDIEGKIGFGVSFEALINYIMDRLPVDELISDALRQETKTHPKVALREFVANALVHQDFLVSGMRVMIEVFSDRIEITNPGIPLMDPNRFIDTPPKSRNEQMAKMAYRLGICESRGSGVDRAIESIEHQGLPAPKFIREEDYTRVIMYASVPLDKMSVEDRVRACYQHTCLHYVNSEVVNNSSVRKRFSISKNNYTMASKILGDTIAAGLIKPADPESASKKYASYVPYWA